MTNIQNTALQTEITSKLINKVFSFFPRVGGLIVFKVLETQC